MSAQHDNSQLKLRSRDWCFTHNNYKATDEALLQQLDSKYLIYGREVAPETGTPHLQGYIYFANAKFGHQLQKILPRGIRFFKRRAKNVDDAIDYCTKDGSNADFHEQGERPCNQVEKGERGKAAASWAIKKARTGDLQAIEDEQPKLFLQYGPRLEGLYEPPNKPLDVLEHEWWVGGTGTGKSRLLWELYPGHYAKRINKWWDGYKRQDVVAIEEWSPDARLTAQSLKQWADHYPFPGEIKNGNMQGLRPRKIIVLSNYTIEQCFERSEDRDPMLRRFKVIHFPEGKQEARFRAQLVPTVVTPEVMDDTLEKRVEMAEIISEELDLPHWDWTGLFDTQLSPML